MTLSLDLSKDYLIVNDTQSVGYLKKIAEGTYATVVSVPFAYWEAPTSEDYRISPELLAVYARVVNVWQANLSAIIPRMGDQINDQNGQVFVAKRVQLMDLDKSGLPQRYRVTCWRTPA